VRWRPTHAQARAVCIAAGLLMIAALARRPDAAVFGVPLAFVAVWGRLFRPQGRPVVRQRLDRDVLFEGQATTYRLTVAEPLDPHIDMLVMALPRAPWFRYDPPRAALAVPAKNGKVSLEVGLCSERWGVRLLDSPHVIAASGLGAYRMALQIAGPLDVRTLPLREGFEAVDVVPRPAGLVGLHRSRRPGDGTELSGVRPFRAGDRLRRINWPVSARMGELHVTSTWSDRDTEVVIVLDTSGEVGVSEGIDGRSNGLDTAVRAAAALSEHYLRHGDRVRLIDAGAAVGGVPAGAGRAHLRRILDVLAHADRTSRQSDGQHWFRNHRIRPDSLILVLSPLLEEHMLGSIVTLVHSGCTVIAVDTLPAEAATIFDQGQLDSKTWLLAWRIRMLERRAELDRLGDRGVPTVRWRGAGTLDEVLRNAARLKTAPRMRT
jgi:uncharacterized protein (DUF58 family)